MPDIREFDEMWPKFATAHFGFPPLMRIGQTYLDSTLAGWKAHWREGGGGSDGSDAPIWVRDLPLRRDGWADPGADPAADWNKPETDPTNPDYYKFPNGAETIDITEWLSGCGAQAVQYIVRATRTDGKVKGDPIEDLTKTLWFVRREIDRLTAQS